MISSFLRWRRLRGYEKSEWKVYQDHFSNGSVAVGIERRWKSHLISRIPVYALEFDATDTEYATAIEQAENKAKLYNNGITRG